MMLLLVGYINNEPLSRVFTTLIRCNNFFSFFLIRFVMFHKGVNVLFIYLCIWYIYSMMYGDWRDSIYVIFEMEMFSLCSLFMLWMSLCLSKRLYFCERFLNSK